MSGGFQDIAAAIGIADLALRSILRIYEFVKYMKDAPEAVIRLCAELSELNGCLCQLSSLNLAGSPTQSLFKQLELSTIVNRCGESCCSLEADLRKWTQGGRETLVSRLRVRFNKSRIESAISSISSTKETIILAVSISSLHLQNGMAMKISSAKKQVQAWEKSLGDIDLPDAPLIKSTHTSTRLSEKHGEKHGGSVSDATTITAEILATHRREEPKNHHAPRGEAQEVRTSGMDVQHIRDNEISGSTGTIIGCSTHMVLREQTIERNKVLNSQNTVISRYPHQD